MSVMETATTVETALAPPPRARRTRARRYKPPEEYERLFRLIADLRCPSSQALHVLFFAPVFGDGGAPLHIRATQRRLKTLATHRFIVRRRVPGSLREVVHLTTAGRSAFASVERAVPEQVRKKPTLELMMYGWVRSSLWAAFATRGYTVSHGLDALLAVRRCLVDRQKTRVSEAGHRLDKDVAQKTLSGLRESLLPWFAGGCTCGRRVELTTERVGRCGSCGHAVTLEAVEEVWSCSTCGQLLAGPEHGDCAGVARATPYVDYDVAYRADDTGSYDVTLLVSDKPYASTRRQVDALPLRRYGQPALSVVCAPTDEISTFDPSRGEWFAQSPRYRQLLGMFTPKRRPGTFPFHQVTHLQPVPPEACFRVLHKRKK